VPLDLLRPEVQADLRGPGAECLSVVLAFPDGADDNVAQSDSITFGLHTVAEGPGGGVSTSAGTAGTGGGRRTSTSGAVVQANRGRGAATGPNTAAGAVPPPGTTAPRSDGGGAVVGEQTTPVQVDGDTVAVRTEAASRSLGDLLLVWGSLLVGVVVLGLVFFLWFSRRRRREA
jgi:cobalamin biosynthesis Mg chelatase CobN